MCGIAAWITTKKRGPALRHGIIGSLAAEIQSRGSDSWGMAHLSQNGEVRELRRLGRITTAYRRWETYTKMMELARGPGIMLMHTRAATKGAVTKRNAHPFTRGGWTVVHNGWITNDREIARQMGVKFECDSELIACALANNRRDLLTEMRGSFAVLAFNREEPGKLYVCGQSNPCKIIRLSNGDVLFCSTKPDVDTSLVDIKEAREISKSYVITATRLDLEECEWFRFGPSYSGYGVARTYHFRDDDGWDYFERGRGYARRHWKNAPKKDNNKPTLANAFAAPRVLRNGLYVPVYEESWRAYIADCKGGSIATARPMSSTSPVLVSWKTSDVMDAILRTSILKPDKSRLKEIKRVLPQCIDAYRNILATSNWPELLALIVWADAVPYKDGKPRKKVVWLAEDLVMIMAARMITQNSNEMVEVFWPKPQKDKKARRNK